MELISRRTALLRGGVALAGAAFASLVRSGGAVAAPTQTNVYKLVPTRTCRACSACKSHGHNKLFATKDAADAGRAHRGCRCRIRRTGTVTPEQRAKLFGNNGSRPTRTAVDARWPWVQEILSSRRRRRR